MTFDVIAADRALKKRADFLRVVGLEAREAGNDIGTGPVEWDGENLTFSWLELRPEDEAPAGWIRYGKNYW